MNPQPAQQPAEATPDGHEAPAPVAPTKTRTESFSAKSENSQTAADFIRDQMQLEADAREALPYSIETCTKPLGPLRQAVFSCLTCNPPPADPKAPYNAAGICYSCSVQCHGEHTLVEIFAKRNFTCDCGTTRFPATSPCNLRINEETGTKGGVHSEEPDANNKYNHNFRNRFCGCECDYDPFEQKGTMFQCLGLGTAETGGCGEDWYHPGCIVGLGPDWLDKMAKKDKPKSALKTEVKTENGFLPTIAEDETTEQNGAHAEEAEEEDEDNDPPPPPSFPADDDFEGFICYKCVEAYPWIKRYAGTKGFLPPVYLKKKEEEEEESKPVEQMTSATSELEVNGDSSSKKRKASDDDNEDIEESKEKKPKTDETSISETVQSATTNAMTTTESITTNGSSTTTTTTTTTTAAESTIINTTTISSSSSSSSSTATQPKPCLLSSLPPPSPPTSPSQKFFSLFFTTPDFRSSLCHCPTCFPLLLPHPQLLEEEDTYEPPVSETSPSQADVHSQHGGSSKGSGSILERGESALRNIDRVRAIEGVMAYNHLKDKLKPFFREFAESGRAVSAEDIKGYFAKLRGDEEVRRGGQGGEDGEEEEGVNGGGDGRKEQDGY